MNPTEVNRFNELYQRYLRLLGSGRTGKDHRLWANAFFAERGLFTMRKAYILARQPDEKTTDWRAACGRTARTVRRAGRIHPSRPLSSTCVPQNWEVYFRK